MKHPLNLEDLDEAAAWDETFLRSPRLASFMITGPLLRVPGILVGLGQNYLMLAATTACGQYSRLYVR